MFLFLLAIIYVAFIGLGLPDSLIGSSWPVMHIDLGVPVSYMGIITMIISAGTIISSLMSDYLTRKLGAGLVTAVSVFLTAAALFCFSLTESFALLCLLAVPYGIGAGAVDAALNNYVALHYSSRHMSWLHCFWGVGTIISPYIMGFCLDSGKGWSDGFFTVSIIQIVISAILFMSLPMWKKRFRDGSETSGSGAGIISVLKIRGVKSLLITFFAYCSLENTAGLWASTYFVESRGISPVDAARYAAMFYIGITAGRFISGFIADWLGDKRFIRTGLCIICAGLVILVLPFKSSAVSAAGLIITGLGCAPVYPCIIHATPDNFGEGNSQAIIGIQMASAYLGSTLMPPVFGVIARRYSTAVFPYYLIIFAVLMFVMSEKLNREVKSH